MAIDVSILWFRNDQRLHDNPALLEAIKIKEFKFLPIFILDEESYGLKSYNYNRVRFLFNSLKELNTQFQKNGGRLYIFCGKPVEIFLKLAQYFNIKKICFEQDCEPIWQKRDDLVKNLCTQFGIEYFENISHTLWDPQLIIKTNGGIAPLTYQMFLHTVKTIGPPPRPVQNADFHLVNFVSLPKYFETELNSVCNILKPEELIGNLVRKSSKLPHKWKGGETEALNNFNLRLQVEENAFKNGFYLPNQANVDILGESKSVSAHLRFGNLSVRRFYWEIHDLFEKVQNSVPYICRAPKGAHITGQLIWREYFYTMSVNNPYYDAIDKNEICLNIPWNKPNGDKLERWKTGQTGFPLVDAAMRQLLTEGWLHHTLRNLLASFLTRGGLWFSWEFGLQHFLKYLIDADWSVCAGNWMWVSSSAFEKLLDSSKCTCPIALARRLDPNGEYITRYVPELKNLPKKFIHEPWKTPENVQTTYGCVLGINYPHRIIDLKEASEKNCLAMQTLRESFIQFPDHCRPSSEAEIRQFFWIS